MTHSEQIREAKRKILELEREKQRIDEELEAWTHIRDAHEALAKNSANQSLTPEKIGFTEAIVVILRKHPKGLIPTEIRDRLRDYDISCGSEKNFMSNIHVILRRHPEIESFGEGGRKVYRLKEK